LKEEKKKERDGNQPIYLLREKPARGTRKMT
jgi:hypothetical protein